MTIFCEGLKTEPHYISALARAWGLTTISIPKTNHTDPIGLVRLAIKELDLDKSLDFSIAMFDRDEHDSFDNALQVVRQHSEFEKRLWAVCSYPCFEVWLIYHFCECRKPMNSAEALKKLEALFPEFAKGNAQCMDELIERIDVAAKNARIAHKDAVAVDELNPSTDFHDFLELIEKL